MKTALITGVTGQDGAYLSQLLLSKGYEVHGLVRRSSTSDVSLTRLEWLGITRDVRLVDGDQRDLSGLLDLVDHQMPLRDLSHHWDCLSGRYNKGPWNLCNPCNLCNQYTL